MTNQPHGLSAELLPLSDRVAAELAISHGLHPSLAVSPRIDAWIRDAKTAIAAVDKYRRSTPPAATFIEQRSRVDREAVARMEAFASQIVEFSHVLTKVDADQLAADIRAVLSLVSPPNPNDTGVK
jgi:hypothetical protein